MRQDEMRPSRSDDGASDEGLRALSQVTDHYDRLLAEQYTWMLGGDLGAAATEQTALLRGLGLRTDDGGLALDLGCGPGPQSLALVELGYSAVVAVDTSAALLDELTAWAAKAGVGQRIRPLHADLRHLPAEVAPPAGVAAVVCMGDTLTHLPRKADVTALCAAVATALRPGGQFVLGYRDLSVRVRGTDRFAVVRGDADRVLTCFLEDVDDDTVMVHDLLHQRTESGWELRTGAYPKLRLAADWVAAQCRAAGLRVRRDEPGPHGVRLVHAVRD
jgi:SAM-dependent methyltransferase